MRCGVLNTYISDLFAVPLDFLDFVAVSTTVNWTNDHDQIARVRSTRTFSDATFSSLNESKNSMMSAAVPVCLINYSVKFVPSCATASVCLLVL